MLNWHQLMTRSNYSKRNLLTNLNLFIQFVFYFQPLKKEKKGRKKKRKILKMKNFAGEIKKV